MREIQGGQFVSTTIRWIAHGPHPVVMIYEGYKVNGICYNTKRRDDTRTIQNSGVMFVASTMHVASAKDKNPIIADMSFYGVIQGIWEVSYNTFGVTLFRSDWVDTKNGVRVDDLGFTLVDLNRIGHYSDSFILASQARKVFYVKDRSDDRWSVVVKPQEKDFIDNCYNDELGDTSLHCPAILECPADMTREDEEIPYIRVDCEGTWCITRGPTGMPEITRVSCDGHKRVVEYNELGQPIGESATKLKSFIGTTVRVHVLISYQSWKDVPTELKDKIYELIEGGFVVDPRSKKSILQNASVCFRNFKSSLTTKHVLSYKKDLEKLKDPPTEYSFIDHEHWNIFVASRLTEQFEMVSNKGCERRKNNKYNHRMSRKGYANLTEEMVRKE
ncbi:hypothetical protein IC582_008314 [Cucumis melo]